MTLKEHIDEIRHNLTKNVFTSEALVSEGIVRRLLEALNWPKYNTQVIIPEHSLGKGERVDFALCHPPSRPRVFIEVKQVGQIDEDAEEQLFKYAGRENVPIAVLTDGREWYFFYPSGLGGYDERRVFQLNLAGSDLEESAEYLSRYLDYESIRTGTAIKAIENDHREISVRRQIDDVWSRLLQQESELVELMAKEVEILHGHRPSDEQVLKFLNELARVEPHPNETPRPPGPMEVPVTPKKTSARFVVTMPDGERIDCPVAADTFVKAIEKLGLELVEEIRPKLLSTTNTYRVSRKIGRYYININFTNEQKKNILENLANALAVQLQVESHPKESRVSKNIDESNKLREQNQHTRFVVTMSDGERIDNPVAAATYAEVIEKLGLEQVEKIQPALLSTSNEYRASRKRGRYYINTHLSNDQKKKNLENLAETLGVRLRVVSAPKN